MKNRKRIFSIITIMAMFASMQSINVLAATDYTTLDWLPKAPLGIHAYIEGGNSLATAEAATEQAYEGKYSLNLDSFTSGYSARTVEANIPLTADAKSGDKYKVSFYYMNVGSGWMQNVEVRFTNTVNNQSNLKSTTHNTTSTLDVAGEQWHYVEYEGTLSADAHYLQIHAWGGNKYFDNIEIRKVNEDGSLGENIVFNGDFEQVKYYNDTTTYPVKWVSKYIRPNVNDYKRQERATLFESTDVHAQSGDRSLLVYLGYKGGDEMMQVETYLKDILKEDTKYKMTFYTYRVKVPSGNNAANYTGHGSIREYDYDYAWNAATTDDSREWKKIERTFNGRGKNTIGFNIWDPGAILIDNITLYELDADGNIVGDNLMINGDFEEYFDYAAAKEASARIENSNWNVEMNNQPEGAKVSDYVSYVDKGNGDYAAYLHYGNNAAADSSVSFYNNTPYTLENGKDYRVQFDAKISFEGYYDAYYANIVSIYLNAYSLTKGSEQNGYVIEELEDGWRRYSFTHGADSSQGLEKRFRIYMQRQCDLMLDNISVCEDFGDGTYGENLVVDGDFQCASYQSEYSMSSELKYYEGDTLYDADGIWIEKEPMKYHIETTVKNNLVDIDGGMPLTLICAVYKNGELEDVTFMEKKVSVGSNEVYETGNIVISDNSEGDYEIKIMYWDSFADCCPYAPAQIFNSVE